MTFECMGCSIRFPSYYGGRVATLRHSESGTLLLRKSRQMRTIKTRNIFLTLALTAGIGVFFATLNPPRPLVADEPAIAAAAANIFRGTYEGGYWGTAVGAPIGGDVKSTVSTTGSSIITLPGPGTGTVSATGTSTIKGKLTVSGISVNITFSGKFKATKNPATGAVLSVVGSGTWKSTTPGITATGKWLVQRTLTTP